MITELDNLQPADGDDKKDGKDINLNQETEETSSADELAEKTEPETENPPLAETVAEESSQEEDSEDIVETTEAEEAIILAENDFAKPENDPSPDDGEALEESVELSPESVDIKESEEPVGETVPEENPVIEEPVSVTENDIIEKTEEVTSGAEDIDSEASSEEEKSTKEPEEIQEKNSVVNYNELSVEDIIIEAKQLLNTYPASRLKDQFVLIREALKKKFDQDESQKKEEFLTQGGNEIDFYYDNPLKKEAYAVVNRFRNQLDSFHKEQEKKEKDSLEERGKIIEELKSLYQEPNDTNANLFAKFRDLKTRWNNAGNVPKAQAGNLFKTYYFHLDNFYKYLDLNKELQDLDYAHNLSVRQSIIKRAEELVKEENIQKALNELQYLHRLWKEEAVPVKEEFREPTWQKFKELTNVIHGKKSALNEKIKSEQADNLILKQEIIEQIREINLHIDNISHGEWQMKIKEINELKNKFMSIGRIPKEDNNNTWSAFKEVSREFILKKNEFYKSLKNEQQENLSRKMELLKIANDNKDSTEWNDAVQIFKRIQDDWRKIGHVPRKDSDKIWKDFRDACNHFFDRYKSRNTVSNEQFENNYKIKLGIIENLKKEKLPSSSEEALEIINHYSDQWNSVGRVPAGKTDINQIYNKTVAEKMKSLNMSDSEIQDYKLDALITQIKTDGNGRLLDDEIRRTKKLMDDLEKEIHQLDNNVSFFSNAKDDNPLLKDVYRQIEEKRRKLVEAEVKYRKLIHVDFV